MHSKFQSIVEVEGKDTLPDEDREWFVWETKFRGKDTTLIENRYTAEYSRCNCTREKSVAYVLGTGRSWKSSIGKGKVTFKFDNSISALWFKDASLPDPKMKSVKKNDRLEIEFQKYEPRQDDYIGLNFFCPWEATSSFGEDSAFSGFLRQKTRNQLREMRNEVFARNGFVFKDSALSILFSRKPWYAPNKGITASMIPIAEQKTVADIKAIEDRM